MYGHYVEEIHRNTQIRAGPAGWSLGIAPEKLAQAKLFKPVGCDKCLNTGYRGRVGIYEIMLMGNQLKSLIQRTYDAFQIKAEALKQGMTTLRGDGLEKVVKGVTTVEEVIRETHK